VGADDDGNVWEHRSVKSTAALFAGVLYVHVPVTFSKRFCA